MTALELLDAVQNAGGSLTLNDDQIKYALPKWAAWLVFELKQNREELIGLLREGKTPPPLPHGVRLLRWKPKNPPIAIVHIGIVNDVDKFVGSTVRQLRARLEGNDFLAGNWSLRELVDRLEQVGMVVKIESASRTAGRGDERNS